jgi:GNAT superfamily N-acetyltransferase
MQTPDIHGFADAPAVRIRSMQAADASTVAALHAASWQRAYRGILTNAYLDSDLDGERRAAWTTKLSVADGSVGWLVLVDNAPAGFVFVRPRDDAQWGTLVDNLHVLAAHQGHGLGRRLLHTVGSWTAAHTPDVGVHLWVFADNVAARGFYRRVGGHEVERTDRAAADGRLLPEYRVAWSSPDALVAATRG